MSLFTQYNEPSTAASAGVLERQSKQFPQPWLDPASAQLPSDITQVFRFCELLWYSNGIYSQAMNRIASYFVTRIKIEGVDNEKHDRWQDYLQNVFFINKFMVSTGRNFLAYGNVMMTPRVAVSRFLRCPCNHTAPIQQWKYRFNAGKFRPEGKGCPRCRRTNELERLDFRPLNPKSIDVRIWNPHSMKLKYNGITDRLVYRHILSRQDAEMIRRGDPDMLEDTPWEFVEAAMERVPIRVANDRMYHLRDMPLAGIDSRGVGVPRGMANFRQAFLTQVLMRLNMVLGLEYSTPFRSVTPEPGGSEGMDPSMGNDLGDVTSRLTALLSDWKRDPAAIHTFPIPLRYTAWGGEGLQLASHQVQEQAMTQLLTGLGIPVDFFTGSFKSERTFVPTLRLMERTWEELVSSYNATLSWLAETLSDLLRWDKPKLTMESVTTADDLELRQMLMDLYMQGRVSGTTAFETIQKNPVDENKKMLEEQVEMQADADKAKAKQEKAMGNLQQVSSTFAPPPQQPGQPGAPADPNQAQTASPGSPAMGNTPVRPQDLLEKAQAKATELLAKAQEQRRPELKQLQDTDPLLHDAVVKAMEEQRSARGSDAAQSQQG